MHYDPVKQTLGRIFNRWLFTRRVFYRLLDLLLLRTWHIHRELHFFLKERGKDSTLDLLDAGSGFGQYTYYLSRKRPVWRIKGVDLKEDEIISCRHFFERSGIDQVGFHLADLVTFREEETYDLILSVDVMEHIEEDEAVLDNFFSSLKPGGMLLINTPSDKGGSGVKHEGESSFIDEHVRDGYGIDEMGRKLREAGFSNIRISYTYGWPGNISWHLTMKYPIMLLGVSMAFLFVLPLYYLLIMPPALILNFLDVRLTHKSGTGLLATAWKLSQP